MGDSAKEGPCQHPKGVNKSSLIKLLFQHLIRLFLVELEVFFVFFFFCKSGLRERKGNGVMI